MTELGLSYVSHNRTNPEVEKKLMELGGKTQVPMLVDPNHDLVLYESADIVKHLEKHYS
jgi:glutathione S-transferase